MFITTRQESTTGQVRKRYRNLRRGRHRSPLVLCQTMKECPNREKKFPGQCKTQLPIYPGFQYPGTAFCMEYTWCPIFGQGGYGSTVEDLDWNKLEALELEFSTYINWFPWQAGAKAFSNTKKIKLDELLKEAGIKTKDLKAIKEKGCVIYAKFAYGTYKKPCNTAANCEPQLRVVRLDQKPNEGFKLRRSNYYRGNGTVASQKREMRDVHRQYGIRVVTTASGHGETFSITACLLQISLALAMAKLIYFAADIFVIYLSIRFLKYRAFKFDDTPDFGDIKEAEEAKKIDALAGKKGKKSRKNRARFIPAAHGIKEESDDEG